MPPFVGRERYLDALAQQLREVRRTGTARFVLVRGRRRVGKSRLVQELVERNDVPYVYFQASKQPPRIEVALFAEAIARSSLPVAELVPSAAALGGWEAAFELIAGRASRASPAIVVIDELPWLTEGDPGLEGTLQKVWDLSLERRAAVLLIVIGSDLAMMEALTEYGRPLHGRPTKELVVQPFSPLEVAKLLKLDGARALDAYLVVGGFPLVAGSWSPGADLPRFLRRALEDPTAPLIVDAERMLNAEFPPQTQARAVLSAIGTGERTFSGIQQRSGVGRSSLDRALKVLVDVKRVVARERPASLKSSSDSRYSLADPYLRFWLRFIEPNMAEFDRGRGRLVAAEIARAWPDYRGKAVEPIVREAITRLLPDPRLGQAKHVGGWWNRTNSIEVDLVGLDRAGKPRGVAFVGSIKWRERAAFRRSDTRELIAKRVRVPGVTAAAKLLGVSRAGFSPDAGLDVALGPDEIVGAWRAGARFPRSRDHRAAEDELGP